MDKPKDVSSNELPTAEACDSSGTNASTITVCSPVEASGSPSEDLGFIGSGRCEVPCPPYIVGTTFTAISHEPPAPFGRDYTTKMPGLPKTWKEMSQLDTCLSRSSLGGQSITHVTRTMTITATIRSGYGRGAQILVMDNDMVAKVYDPLYYEFVSEYGYTEPVVSDADGDYSREAAAYAELQLSQADVDMTPRYYGTFTIDIDTPANVHGNKQKRSVPLILLEHLRGHTMADIDPTTLTDGVRSAILKKAIIAESIIHHIGINHYDFCPRNIIILNFHQQATASNPEHIDKQVRIKVIDFNVATVRWHPKCEFQYLHVRDGTGKKKSLSRMLSPIDRNHGQMMEFYDWVPECTTAEEWLWEQFHGDKRFRPVFWDPKYPLESPKYLDDSEDDSGGSSDSGISMEVKKE